MKIFKTILLVILGIVALILIIAAFVKKDYTLQKEVTINKTNLEVYEYIRMNENQPKHNSWFRMDPNTKTEMRGTDGEVGAVWCWDSEKTGKGEQKIVALTPGEKLDFEITFIKPFEGKAQNSIVLEAISPTQTKVVNSLSSSMPYPMNFMLLFMDMDKAIGTEMQNGLNNIKQNLEQ